jgi:hypothetical protein
LNSDNYSTVPKLFILFSILTFIGESMKQKKSMKHINDTNPLGYIKFHHLFFSVIVLYIYFALIIFAISIHIATAMYCVDCLGGGGSLPPGFISILSSTPPSSPQKINTVVIGTVQVQNTGGTAVYGFVECKWIDPTGTIRYAETGCTGPLSPGQGGFWNPQITVDKTGTWTVTNCTASQSKSYASTTFCPHYSVGGSFLGNAGAFNVINPTTSTTIISTSTLNTTTIPPTVTCTSGTQTGFSPTCMGNQRAYDCVTGAYSACGTGSGCLPTGCVAAFPQTH